MTRPFKLDIPCPVPLNCVFHDPSLQTGYSVTRLFKLDIPCPAPLNCIFRDPPL